MNIDRLHEILQKGLADEAYPCFAAAVGDKNGIAYRELAGNRAIYPEKLPLTEDTLFDMASLSKVIGTTMTALRMIEEGKLALHDTLSQYFDNCYDKGETTVLQLMTHTSGIPSHIKMWEIEGAKPEEAIDIILRAPFDYKPGTETVYSCMGFILLAKILEKIEGEPLSVLAKRYVFDPLGMTTATYCPAPDAVCAATELDPATNEYICGVVHDENARFLGGISGNAGVFCSLADSIKFAEMLANRGKGFLSPRLFELAIHDFTPDCSESRGLGFQLKGWKYYPAGDLISYGSYGHTGFTGTAIYVDNELGRYAVLLTNRVHFGRANGKLMPIRRRWFNVAFMTED